MRELEYRWEWQLRSAPEQLWPFVADTNRFNRDTGLPSVQPVKETSQSGARRYLRYVRFGVPFEWEEEPFEWQEPTRFGVRRRYRTGPIVSLRVEVELIPQPAGGTRLVYRSWLQPRNLLGWLGAPVAMSWLTRRSFARAFRRYDDLAQHPPPVLLAPTSDLASGAEARIAAIERDLIEASGDPDLVGRLIEVVRQGDDLTVGHLRPYALADAWQAPRRAVLELCLRATRAGLLDLQWDILCPLCRGAAASHSGLAEMKGTVHCPTCNIDVSANFDRSVELTFRPASAIRAIATSAFCVAGPRVTPHVVVQQLLRPGEERAVSVRLQPGRYRIRTLGRPGGQFLVATSDGRPTCDIVAAPGEWPIEEVAVSLAPTFHLANGTGDEQLFIVERLAWTDQATTAAEVTSLQLFRDLFSSELIRPGELISVGSLTILFTDLRDSTTFYRRVGDAPAFASVLDHFAVLREEVARADGAVVKTIGDAIMAVFPRPAPALQATLQAQRRLAAPAASGRALYLKAGLHQGPCIAVTLNERLDYFGSSVNFAARLERFSSGADIVVSDAVYRDPEVAALLASASGLTAEEFGAPLKGFEDEAFRLWRIKP